jgi:antitoxin MazE
LRARIVQVGNSKGIRIPKPLLEQTGLDGDVEIDVEGDRIIIAPVTKPRAGWAAAFRAAAEQRLDEPIDSPSPTRFDEEEWEW